MNTDEMIEFLESLEIAPVEIAPVNFSERILCNDCGEIYANCHCLDF